ncbi:MAG TPA: LPS biosynthesis protein WbpP, partial [Planctomycetota bacterium]|nr:LPS biosynthesis protein WbpP [Planctomycetota bacterium]
VAGQPLRPQFLPPRVGDIRDSWADVEAAARDLGVRAGMRLEEGLARTFEAYAAAVGAKA